MKVRTPGSGRRRSLRTAIGGSALVAALHLSATSEVVRAYTASDLEDEPKYDAVALWYLSAILFASVPIALAWSDRAPAERARPVQAYAGVIVGGLTAASLPVALHAHGPSGLVKMPQWLVGGVLVALIAGGMTPRTERVAGSDRADP